MYVEYDENGDKPFKLNILMDKAEEDLFDIIKKGQYTPMGLD